MPPLPAFRPNGKAFEFYHAGEAANLSPDGLVAIVEGRNIRVEDVADTVAALPDAMRELPYDTLYPMVLEMLVNHTVLAQEAIRQGLDNDKGVQRRMRMAGYLVLEKELLDRFVEGKITEIDLHRRYDDRYGGRPGIEEARTRVITLRTYDEAVEAIAALDHGSDFAAMARDRSLDPSRSRGGDLGYIRRERLHPSQAEAVFALEKGGHSVKPVRDNRGWSVVQVDERRMRPVPPYDEARAVLRQELMRELINEEIARIRAHTRFKQYNLDGSPLETDDRNAAWHIVAVPK